jgi:hypothetical protein
VNGGDGKAVVKHIPELEAGPSIARRFGQDAAGNKSTYADPVSCERV